MKKLLGIGTIGGFVALFLFTGCGYTKINHVQLEENLFVKCTDKQIIEQSIPKEKIIKVEYLSESEYNDLYSDKYFFDYFIVQDKIMCREEPKQYLYWNKTMDILKENGM